MAVDVFGGGPVQPAVVAYRAIDLTDDLQLFWANSYLDTTDVVAANMNVTNEADTAFSITMPDATQVGVGTQCVFSNIGASNFTIYTNTGTLIRTAIPGTSYYLLLTDNSTPGGVWTSLVFGGTTSSASAADLAGFGLVALPNPPGIATLNTDIVTVVTSDNGFAPNSDNRANLIVWTGGSDSVTLPALVLGDAGYYISFNNQGSGLLTILPVGPALFDGVADVEVGIGQSLTAVWNGTNWYSIGFGQELFFQFTVLNKSVAGNTDITLTPTESSNQVQQYSGLLTGNITIYFPAIVFEWIVFNNTTGAFNLTVQLAGPTGTPYIVPQGSRQSFYSDGTSLRSVPTVIVPSSTTFPNGTVGAPGIAFTASPNTGFRRPAANELNVVAGATDVINVTSTAVNLLKDTAVTGSISVTDRTPTLNNIAPASPTTGQTLLYNGTNWIAGGISIIDNLMAESDTAGSALTNTTYALIPGMSVSYPSSSTASSFLIIAQLNISSDQVGLLRLYRDSTAIAFGTPGGNTTKFAASTTYLPYTMIFIDSPATAGAIVYSVRGALSAPGTYYLNRDMASAGAPGYSSLQVFELGGF